MFKNKYVFWGFVGIWVALLVGAGAWFVISRGDDSKSTASLTRAVSDGAGTGSGQSQTIENPGTIGTGITINGNTASGSGQTLGNSTGSSNASSSDVSKLLDPTTFAQYDKYKNDQNTRYIDLQAGAGDAVAEGKTAVVLYKGWLTNGSLFDESKQGSDGKYQAFSFVQGQHQVISGWEDGLTGMKAGGVRLLIIPPAAGYGATGQGPIPGNSVLVFQVQLVQVQ